MADCVNSGTDRSWSRLTQGPAVTIGRPPPPAAPKSGRRARPVVPPEVAGQASACRCGAGTFDATPPENLTQVCRSWGPKIVKRQQGWWVQQRNQCVRTGQWSVRLTDLLTKRLETGETARHADDHQRSGQQVSETRRDDGDAEDGRRSAHNPEVAGSNPAPATRGNAPGRCLSAAFSCCR